MFPFMKKVFFVAMEFFGYNLLKVNPLKCVLMNNQECKIIPQILTVMNVHFILRVFKQVNAVVVVIVSMIHIQKYVFLMLLKK